MTDRVTIIIKNSGGEIRAEGEIACTFAQLADALSAAYTNASFVTLQLHPSGVLAIERKPRYLPAITK